MKKIGIVMNSIAEINFQKDSTLLLMSELQNQGTELYYIENLNLYFANQTPMAIAQKIEVFMNENKWFDLQDQEKIELTSLDLVLMRQDPPFDMNFINNTYVLEAAENKGLKVVNRPSSLRKFNEKLSILNYPSFITDTLVTSNKSLMEEFINTHKKVVSKPLGLMGGEGVQIINTDNSSEALSNISSDNLEMLMLQKFIDEVYLGDRRILLINGNLPESVVLRKPPEGDFRGNLAIGGTASTEILNERDKEIASVIGKDLIEQGIFIAGLDVVGGFLTEINITCPTCFRELLDQTGENLAKSFVDQLKIAKS
tara:strand:- start:3818 stop:4756 length:939 start_codon:yes stop_codon:yes gene_type:complete